MNGVSMSGATLPVHPLAYNASRIHQPIQFGSGVSEPAVRETGKILAALVILGKEFSKAIPAAIVAITLKPAVKPLENLSERLLWNTDDKAAGVVTRNITKGFGRVRNFFSKEAKNQKKQAQELIATA